MRKTFSVVFGLLLGVGGTALGVGGNLDKPSIATPADPKTKVTDPVAQQIAEVLLTHQKEFTGGSFLNSRSELYFAGGVKGVNAMLGDLAKVEGAKIHVRMSKEVGVTRRSFPTTGAPPESPCDLKIEHLGWGDARAVSLTIYLGGGLIDPSELSLPSVTGRKPQAVK